MTNCSDFSFILKKNIRAVNHFVKLLEKKANLCNRKLLKARITHSNRKFQFPRKIKITSVMAFIISNYNVFFALFGG